ncbi:hypothetical protein [Nostoc sp. C052]|nr:hypothetical protein [Nostoc sp. C052]
MATNSIGRQGNTERSPHPITKLKNDKSRQLTDGIKRLLINFNFNV